MTQEEKQLLLKDLCGRLPYGHIKCKWIVKSFNPDTFDEEFETNEARIAFIEPNTNSVHLCGKGVPVDIGEVKPYLRPMSSMTDEEKKHLQLLHNIISDENYGDGYSPCAWDTIAEWTAYCNAHHLDYRGLINKGLALKASEEMYKTE